MKNLLLGAALGAATISFAPSAVQAQEITICNEIASLPAVINLPGVYCMKKNLGTGITSGNAITINANNVTFNMNGYRIGGATAGPSTTAIGISAANRRNVIIRNGTIRGFRTGIGLGGNPSSGHLIEDMLIDNVTSEGIRVDGSGVTIRNNTIVNIDTTPPAGGAVSATNTASDLTSSRNTSRALLNGVAPFAGTGSNANGIGGIMSNSLIENNFISNLTSPGQAAGINMVDGGGSVISKNVSVVGNTVKNVTAGTFANPVLILFCSNIIIKDNTFVEGQAPTTEGVFADGNSSGIGCFNNTIVGFATAQTAGCTWESGTLPVLP